ncbi:hypothetical protein ACLOJK_025056 [Asimina triloba]
MAESPNGRDNLIELDEELEGNSIGSDDFVFQKIGEPVPLKANDSEVDLESVPFEGLAVSDRFRVVFLAHSKGFCIARTKDVIELAKEVKEKGKNSHSIQESSILDILIGRVSILALSMDSSMLAACVGGEIHVFSVTSLLNKNSAGCNYWCNNHGMLYHGDLGGSLNDVMDAVDAVDWSVGGDYIAVARKNTLSILSSEFKEQFHMSLLFQLRDIDPDEKGIIKVDSIRWLRSDSIIIGCLKSTDDGNEDSYLLQVIANSGHKIIEASKPEVFSFSELFSCIVDDIVPFGSGPYLYAKYLERWELLIAANRKNTDQHIVLLGWSYSEKKGKPSAIEFKQDKQVPRIELSESGDDNLIVGFGIDKVSLYEKVKFMRDAEHKELAPYCILLCLTSDGKLVMFHVARISDIAVEPEVSSLPSNDTTDGTKDSSATKHSSLVMKDDEVGIVLMDDKSSQVNYQLSGGILQEKGLEVPQLKFSDNIAGQISEKLVDSDGIPKENASQVSKQKVSMTFSDAGQIFSAEKKGSAPTSGSARYGSSSVTSLVMKDNEVGIVLMDDKSSQVNYQLSGGILQEKGLEVPQLKFSDNIAGQISEKLVDSDGIPKENASQVSKQKVSTTFSDAGQIFSAEKKGSGPTSGSARYGSSSVIANKELKSLGNFQKPEVDLQLNDLLAKQKQDSAIAGNLRSEASAVRQQSYNISLESNEVSKGLTEMTGSAGIRSTSLGYSSPGKFSLSNNINSRSSPFASVTSTQGDGQKGTGILTGDTKQLANQSVPPSVQSGTKALNSKISAPGSPSSIFYSGKPFQGEGQRKTGVASAGSTSLSHSFSGSSREEPTLGKTFNTKGTHNLSYQKLNRSRGALDSEQEPSKSYINMSEMTKELDALLSDIEAEGGFRDSCIVLQRNSVLELEKGLENLSEACRVCKNKLNERLSDVEHLRDKIMQVLARKVYIEGIVKQASNSQYWDLWNRQKLSPEFELRRQEIIHINQNLTNQIIELERHFNILELNKFGDSNRADTRQRTFGNSSGSLRQMQAVHSLHTTINSQLAAAEQLSDYLSKQMSTLNIESPPVKKKSVAKELFESIGLHYDGDGFQSPELKRSFRTPESIKKLSLSSFSAIKEQSRKNMSSSLKGVEPETARRRRDSLDRSLASFEPQKTTVKRMLLVERSRVSKDESSFGITNQGFSSQLEDGFSILGQKNHAASSFDLQVSINKLQSNTYSSNKGNPVKPSTKMSEPPSVTLFKWSKDSKGAFETGGSRSSPMQAMQQGSPQQLLSSSTSSLFGSIQNSTQETSVSAEQSGFGPTQFVQFDHLTSQAVSISETRPMGWSETLDKTPSRTSSTISSMINGSQRKEVHTKVQAIDLSNLNRKDVHAKQITGSMQGAGTPGLVAPEKANTSLLPSVSAISQSAGLARNSNQSNMLMNKSKSGETVPVGTFSSSLSFSALASKPTIPSVASSHMVSSALSVSPSSVPAAPSLFPTPAPSAINLLPTEPTSSQSSIPAMSFGEQLSSTKVSLDVNKTWQKSQIPLSTTSPSENSASQAPLQPKAIVDEPSPSSGPAQSPTPVSEVSAGSSSASQPSSSPTTSTFSIFNSAPNVSLNSQHEKSSTVYAPFPTSSCNAVEVKNEGTDVAVTQEDEMEEEAPDTTTELSLGFRGGFGLGSSPAPSAPKPNPFGVLFGAAATNPTSSSFSLTVPSGEVFRPASFSFPSSTQSSQPMNQGAFSGGFGNMAAAASPTGSGFGQPAQVGAGQQALGSVLGAFGQSRQLGPGMPPGGGFAASTSGFGGAGFAAAAKSGGPGSTSGFAGAATGGGFAGIASAGGGFTGVASTGGGFASVASGGGFTGAAGGGGFAAAAGGGSGGFAGAASASGGFGAFSNPQASGGFSTFGSNAMATGKPPELFTQMRR